MENLRKWEREDTVREMLEKYNGTVEDIAKIQESVEYLRTDTLAKNEEVIGKMNEVLSAMKTVNFKVDEMFQSMNNQISDLRTSININHPK